MDHHSVRPPHRVLPESRLSLVTESRFDPYGDLLERRYWLYGPIETPRTYSPEPGVVLEGMFMMPEEAICMLGIRPDELANAILPQSDFELNCNAPDAGQTLAAWAARMLRRSRGRISPKALADRAGVSERHLRRNVKDRLGISPKSLANKIRAQAAIEWADRQARPDWADIAFSFGYSDQAHLNRSIKTATGLSPGALHRERFAESEIFKTQSAS